MGERLPYGLGLLEEVAVFVGDDPDDKFEFFRLVISAGLAVEENAGCSPLMCQVENKGR